MKRGNPFLKGVKKVNTMSNFTIILFLCNWGPHSAFQTLQDQCADIPDAIKMIRIPCTGRISKSLLFKSFEKGADGVAVMGCSPGSCRYGTGTDVATNNITDIRNVLEILGIGKERLRHAHFFPDDTRGVLDFLTTFSNDIQALGKSPVQRNKEPEFFPDPEKTLHEIIANHDVYACQDCGKCSSACPLTLAGKSFSPRALANALISGDSQSPEVVEGIWSCLTCGLCYDRCPSAVNFPDFIKDVRCLISKDQIMSRESHGGFFQCLMRTMASEKVQPDRYADLPGDIRLDPKSKILFFGGCAPYFDTFFRQTLDTHTSDILKDSLRLLNFFDIQPAVLKNEKCCGHDLLWSGDRESFNRLATLNVNTLNALGIDQVVTACPECHHTLSHEYGPLGLNPDIKVTHIYELLEDEIGKGAVDFKRIHRNLTYQDSCRLTRFEDQGSLPRKLIKRLKPDGFQEMQESNRGAICCGNSAWVGCDAYSKALQVKRLKQSKENGRDLLVTSCPKCQIHLRCAMEDPFLEEALKIEMTDLTSIMAKTIYWK
jgi:Fe-S oxidoreductase/coenzyme F420-reducing hydrogenase delta subunit